MRNIIILTLILAACKANQSVTDTFDQLEISKTGCMGPCPEYTLHLASENWYLNAKDNMTTSGEFCVKPNKSQEKLFLEIINTEAFWLADSSYMRGLQKDLPSTIISITNKTRTKRIKIVGKIPSVLDGLVSTLDSLAHSAIWDTACSMH